RRQVGSAQRLQRLPERPGLLRPRPRALSGGDARDAAADRRALSRSGAPRDAEHRAAGARGARRARLDAGGGLVSAGRTVKVDRSRLPELAPTRTLAFPAIEKSTLPNGLRVWTVHHAQVPLVAFTLLVRRGAAADPAGKEGLAAFTAD